MFLETWKMMSSRIYKAVNMSDNLILKDIAIFLADYASLLLGCGATCIRIEKNTRRMADTFGVGFDITILPTHVYVSVWDGDASDTSLAIRKTANCSISFRLNALLSRLSWEVADEHLDFATAVNRFDSIRETRLTGKWEVLFLASCANASFCRLFGGDAVAMLIVFALTLSVPDNKMIGCVHILKDTYHKNSMKEFVRLLSESLAVKKRQNSWI